MSRHVAIKQNLGLEICLLIGIFVAAIMLRVAIGGVGLTDSPVAGLVFAAILASIAFVYPINHPTTRRTLVIGGLGGLALCIPPFLQTLGTIHTQPVGDYLTWSVVVSFVAISEELFLRGILFDAIKAWRGEWVAILIGAVLFALLHLPLYGWQAMPLDFAVGLWLGVLRHYGKSWIAPAIAHVGADLASWWLI